MECNEALPHENSLLLYMLARDELDEEEKQIILGMGERPQRRAAGSEIVEEGSSPTTSCLVLEGYAVRFHLLDDGGRNISALHIPGDFVDLHSLLLSPMDHGVAALSDCTVAFVPHKTLIGLTHTHPHLSRLLWLSTLIDAAMHRRWLVAAGRLSALGRVAHFICEVFVRLKTVNRVDGNSFWLPMTQTHLSDAMGLSVVHINRTLQELRRRGFILWESGTVEILDWEGLRDAAQFDQNYLNLHQTAR